METEEVVVVHSETGAVPSLIREAIATGKIDSQSIKELLDIQMAHEANEAKKAFAQGKTRLNFPSIVKSRKGGSSNYAPYEEVQAIIEPIYKAEGFDLSFDASEQPDEKGGITVYGILLHAQGHSETRKIWQPVQTVSRMMNPNQGIVSATSYGKRALAGLIFNLRFVDADDDAQTFSALLAKDREIVEEAVRHTNEMTRRDCLPDLLTAMQVKTISDIRRSDLGLALETLRLMYREARDKKAP